MAEQIVKTEYSEVMQKSYIDYSMSVITARALPDARDGLKPVQRRVLYAMDQLGLNYDKPHRKSARIVGDPMGKYNPHGARSIYETLVVLSLTECVIITRTDTVPFIKRCSYCRRTLKRAWHWWTDTATSVQSKGTVPPPCDIRKPS